jgi:hypothetical protein
MLSLSDYIILECRDTRPTKPRPRMCSSSPDPLFHLFNIPSDSDIPKLHHVVFSDNFCHVCILDNKLNSVAGTPGP